MHFLKSEQILNLISKNWSSAESVFVNSELFEKAVINHGFIFREKPRVDYNHSYFQRRYLESDSPKNFFKVTISAYKNDYQRLIKLISSGFIVFQKEVKNVIYISNSQIVEFLSKYIEEENIHCDWVFKDPNIMLTHKELSLFKNKVDWSIVVTNPAIKWDFEMVEEFKDYANWSLLSCHPDFIWSIKEIKKFKEYLIFSSRTNHFRKGGTNLKGLEFEMPNGRHFLEKQNGSISYSSYVQWTSELIEEFCDLWDWSQLSANPSVGWNKELIDKFYKFIDFKNLSSNEGVKWEVSIFEKYHKEIDWYLLSSNNNLPWSFELIKQYFARWEWTFGISRNTGINWTYEMLDYFVDKLDFWELSKRSKFPSKSVIHFSSNFSQEGEINHGVHRFSDYQDVWGSTKTEAFHNLTSNPNFYLNRDTLEFCYSNYIEITYPHGNLAGSGSYKTKKVKILEVMGNVKIDEQAINIILSNPKKYLGYFVNDNLFNESIGNYLLSFFDENMLDRLGEMLLEKNHQ